MANTKSSKYFISVKQAFGTWLTNVTISIIQNVSRSFTLTTYKVAHIHIIYKFI